jgi:hypothetical protein
MGRTMPNLGRAFAGQVALSLQITASTEALWLTAPPASDVRRRLKVPQLEALYEAAFLRIFTSWENYLEAVVVRFLSGYETKTHSPRAVAGTTLERTLAAAQTRLYDGRDYLLWHNPKSSADRCAKHLVKCPVEITLRANQAKIEHYAAVRHRIAHASADAKRAFDDAVLAISGGAITATPGRFLRTPDISDPLNQSKWIRVIADDFLSFSSQIGA